MVQFRAGGRGSPLEHGGTFRTRAEADTRRMVIAGDLAALRRPELRPPAPPPAPETLDALYERYLASRLDLDPKSLRTYTQARALFGLTGLGARAVSEITHEQVQAWVAALLAPKPTGRGLAASTVKTYLKPLRGALDFAGRIHADNPARDPRVRLPRIPRKTITPPSRAEFAAIVAAAGRWAAHLRLLEGTGMREDELAGWQIGDIDWRRQRVRVRREQTKGGTHGERWIPLLPDLSALLEAILPPLEDRDPLAPILPHFTARQLWGGLGTACKLAGVVHRSPHELRRRYISRLVLAGVDPVRIARVAGHAKASMSLDEYSGVLLDEPLAELRALRRAVDRLFIDAVEPAENLSGAVPVQFEEGAEAPASEEFPAPDGNPWEVEDTGLEPVTFALPARRSPS
ncbi:MAG: hypothetical protein QOK40_406 [Miltoncostaeaceae bacterium]|nr:hypothetical protein [Miltoncostaeaceae bacterium]